MRRPDIVQTTAAALLTGLLLVGAIEWGRWCSTVRLAQKTADAMAYGLLMKSQPSPPPRLASWTPPAISRIHQRFEVRGPLGASPDGAQSMRVKLFAVWRPLIWPRKALPFTVESVVAMRWDKDRMTYRPVR